MIKKSSAFYFVFGLLVLFLIYFVSANYEVTTFSGENNFTFNEDTSNFYNFTINNSEDNSDANITQINITLPSGFSFVNNTNGDNVEGSFMNTSQVLSWTNSSGIVLNNTIKYVWFNATATTPGNYNITIALTNATNTINYNISVAINDTTVPIVGNVTAYLVNRTSATISWNTSELSNYTLRYNNNTLRNGSYLMNYSVVLTNLISATTYRYNITACDANNNCNTPTTYSFTTSSYVSLNESIYYSDTANGLYDIIVNNSERVNITEILVMMPSNFVYVASSEADNFEGTFTNSSTSSLKILNWSNSSGMVLNNTLKYLLFNATTSANSNGNYTFNVSVTDAYGTGYTGLIVTINDTTTTNISAVGSSGITEDQATIEWTTNEVTNSTVYYDDSSTVTDVNPVDSSVSESQRSTSHSVDLTGLAAETIYHYRVKSCDANNNCNFSATTYEFETDAASGSGSGSTGGSSTSFWTNTESYSDVELSERGSVNTTLAKTERARVKISGTRYYIGVIKLTSTSVTINISDANKLWLQDKYSVGNMKKYDVNADNYYDLQLTLNGIKDSAANITIKYIHELKSANSTRPNFNGTNGGVNETQDFSGNSTAEIINSASQPVKIMLYVIIAVVSLLVIGFIINIIGKIKKKGPAEEEDNLIKKVKKEIKDKNIKSTAKGRVNVKSP